MIENVTAGGVFWNEAHRLPSLLRLLIQEFSHITVVIQESTDASLEIASQLLVGKHDVVLTDEHHGAGDPSYPLLLANVSTPWTFIVSGDETPSADLLDTLSIAVEWAEDNDLEGLWIPFRSTIEGFDFTGEQDSHLRLFRTSVGWPRAKLHSRPMTDKTAPWRLGYISHDRSLDEMVEDYLRYLELGKDNVDWTRHNTMMLHDAVSKVAERRGSWSEIFERPWWPQVRDLAFVGYTPPEG
jgi:hypothetical protein